MLTFKFLQLCFLNSVHAAPDDYAGGRYTATFVAGSTTAEVTIPIDDECFDGLGAETFFGDLVISADAMAKGVRAGSGTVATVNVMDNEPAPEVNFDPTMYEVLENAGYLTSTIVASGPACEDYDVTVATRDGSATCKWGGQSIVHCNRESQTTGHVHDGRHCLLYSALLLRMTMTQKSL